MAGPVETISFVARRLIQFEQRFVSAAMVRRQASSRLFSQISRSLQILIADLERDRVPHEACRDLIFFASLLQDCVEDEIGIQESDKLSQALEGASDKEKLFLAYRSTGDKKLLVEELEKASILIQALANGIWMVPSGGPP